jgi:hypothetical protein
MTGLQLFQQLQSFGDLDVQEDVVMGWIDMAQKKTSLDLPVVQTITVANVTTGMVVSIPTGLFSLISAVTPSGVYPLSNIEIRNQSIVFKEPAVSVTVKFSSIAPTYTSMVSELTIHPSLHAPMVYFLISMYYDMEGEGDSEESGLAERYYQRWVYYRNMAITALMNSDNEAPTREPVSTQDVMPKTRYVRRDPYFE